MEKELTKYQTHKFKTVLAGLIDAGKEPPAIARAIHPDDPKKAKALRNGLWHMLATDLEVQELISYRARARMVAALPRVTRALIRRAERGRPDAIKLLFEASGFHNPRVKHDHTGNVTVTIQGIPRPADTPQVTALADSSRLEDEEDGPVVDAEVVEDEPPKAKRPAKPEKAA